MNLQKVTKANRIFLICQSIITVIDILLAIFTDTVFYILLMFGHILIFVLYNIIMQSFVEYKIHKNELYSKDIHRFFEEIRIYKKAKESRDTAVVTGLRQRYLSVAIALFNIAAVLTILCIHHPDSLIV